MIYLDYAANTPIEKEVLDTYYQATMYYFANPNANHSLGLQAKDIIDQITKKISEQLHVLPEEIIYTSGASEANNLAIKGILERYKHRGKHILISPLEHNSILSSLTKMQELGFVVEMLPLKKNGQVDVAQIKSLLKEDTILVSVCSVDSELGIRQPIEEIGKVLKDYKYCFFHSDASQAIGKVAIDYQNVDLVTVAPHKFYGMLGTGILIKKKNVGLKTQIDGGKSTTVFRSGTPELAHIVSIEKALEIAFSKQQERIEYVKKLNHKIVDKLKEYSQVLLNHTECSLPHVINISLKGIKATKFAELLDHQGVCISTKTSCCPVETPSKMIYALYHDRGRALSSFRISLFHLTTEKEIDEFLAIFSQCYKECFENGKI
ncbi:cysteine desulfurase family protein [Faecalibacillus faecis]|uniref:cysteine desulfurase family protein n=1 Tax=Faecalibacillus faecis TaxID=1982628 RepID=UPI0022E2F150|nr:cysteine desulfurase family protein [Faecalibacillus faecis]